MIFRKKILYYVVSLYNILWYESIYGFVCFIIVLLFNIRYLDDMDLYLVVLLECYLLGGLVGLIFVCFIVK